MRSLHRHPEPPEGDIHSHPQLRHESSHGQYADQDDAGSGSGVSVWEDCSARDPQPVPVSDESGSRGFKSKYQRNINTSTHIYINRPYFLICQQNVLLVLFFLAFNFCCANPDLPFVLPGLRNLWPSPSVHDPDTNQRQCALVLVNNGSSQNQPLSLDGTLLCRLSSSGPPV